MEIDIMDALDDLGYPNSLSDEAVETLLKDGLSSLEFYKLVEWLASELQELCQLESCVTPVTDTEDSASFLLEVRTFLKELQCPYDCLMSGPISECLQEKQNRIYLLDYLCSELICARISAGKRSCKKRALEVEVDSTPVASCLSSILKTLEVDMEDIDCTTLFTAIHSKLEDIISKNPEVVKEPVLVEELTESQWEELRNIQNEMQADYTTRREMLLTRLDVVAQSFKWGENIKGKEEKIHKIYHPLRKEMKTCPNVNISDVIAAREDVLILEKTSSASIRKNMQASLYKVIIADVPDRGGRANEQRPPVEMPSWKKRSDGPQGGRGGGYRGRGGRGDHRSGGGGGGRNDHRGGGGGGGHYKGGSHNRGSGSSAGAFDAMGSYGNN